MSEENIKRYRAYTLKSDKLSGNIFIPERTIDKRVTYYSFKVGKSQFSLVDHMGTMSIKRFKSRFCCLEIDELLEITPNCMKETLMSLYSGKTIRIGDLSKIYEESSEESSKESCKDMENLFVGAVYERDEEILVIRSKGNDCFEGTINSKGNNCFEGTINDERIIRIYNEVPSWFEFIPNVKDALEKTIRLMIDLEEESERIINGYYSYLGETTPDPRKIEELPPYYVGGVYSNKALEPTNLFSSSSFDIIVLKGLIPLATSQKNRPDLQLAYGWLISKEEDEYFVKRCVVDRYDLLEKNLRSLSLHITVDCFKNLIKKDMFNCLGNDVTKQDAQAIIDIETIFAPVRQYKEKEDLVSFLSLGGENPVKEDGCSLFAQTERERDFMSKKSESIEDLENEKKFTNIKNLTELEKNMSSKFHPKKISEASSNKKTPLFVGAVYRNDEKAEIFVLTEFCNTEEHTAGIEASLANDTYVHGLLFSYRENEYRVFWEKEPAIISKLWMKGCYTFQEDGEKQTILLKSIFNLIEDSSEEEKINLMFKIEHGYNLYESYGIAKYPDITKDMNPKTSLAYTMPVNQETEDKAFKDKSVRTYVSTTGTDSSSFDDRSIQNNCNYGVHDLYNPSGLVMANNTIHSCLDELNSAVFLLKKAIEELSCSRFDSSQIAKEVEHKFRQILNEEVSSMTLSFERERQELATIIAQLSQSLKEEDPLAVKAREVVCHMLDTQKERDSFLWDSYLYEEEEEEYLEPESEEEEEEDSTSFGYEKKFFAKNIPTTHIALYVFLLLSLFVVAKYFGLIS